MKTLVLLMMGVGQLMNPAPPAGGSPPTPTYRILTEDGDPILSEGGAYIITESAP